jgi:hypothetical protein
VVVGQVTPHPARPGRRKRRRWATLSLEGERAWSFYISAEVFSRGNEGNWAIALSLGERVSRSGVSSSRSGTGEGSFLCMLRFRGLTQVTRDSSPSAGRQSREAARRQLGTRVTPHPAPSADGLVKALSRSTLSPRERAVSRVGPPNYRLERGRKGHGAETGPANVEAPDRPPQGGEGESLQFIIDWYERRNPKRRLAGEAMGAFQSCSFRRTGIVSR